MTGLPRSHAEARHGLVSSGLAVSAAYVGSVVMANWTSTHWAALLVGSMIVPARRQHTVEVEQIMRSLSVRGYRLHAFRAKGLGLGRYADAIFSSGSAAWSFRGRYVPGCTPSHRSESNCLRFALAWHTRLMTSLRAEEPGHQFDRGPDVSARQGTASTRSEKRPDPAWLAPPAPDRRPDARSRAEIARGIALSRNWRTAMPSNTTTHDESGDRIPRWAATAGRHTFGQRLTAMGVRLFGSATDNDGATPSRRVRQDVLRDYHADNLAAARSASEELVRAGFNTGDVPYGYRAQRVRVTPDGRRPRWRTRLLIEPVEASTVRMIFMWRGEDRLSTTEIRRRLAASRYPAPLDPETGEPGVWTVAMVRAILRNPKYLGRQVWGRTHHGKPTPRTEWIWSEVWVHPPLVTAKEFTAADRRTWGSPASAGANDFSATALPPDQRRAA